MVHAQYKKDDTTCGVSSLIMIIETFYAEQAAVTLRINYYPEQKVC